LQRVQVVAPDKPNFPAGHAAQNDAPADPLNVPLEQNMHVEEPDITTNVPGLQAEHGVSATLEAPAMPYDPEPHC